MESRAMHQNFTTAPLVVAGAPRSGTTWVAETLAAGPDVQLVHEPDNHRLWPAAARAKAGLGRHPVLPGATASTTAYDAVWRDAIAGADNQSLADGGPLAAARLGWRFRRGLLSAVPASAIDDLLAGASTPATRIAGAALRLAPKAASADSNYRVIKTVHGAFALDHITTLTGGPALIVRRDPRNAVASWLDLGWEIPRYERDPGIVDTVLAPAGIVPPPPGSPATELAWAYCLLDYGMATAAAAHPDWITVHHEDLCDEPLDGFRAAVEAAGLPWHEAIEQSLAESDGDGDGYRTVRRRSEQRGRWKSRLSAAQVADVEAVKALFP